MLKIVVFDGGWGGEVVANYLEEELGVVEVVRAIDWKNVPYDEKSAAEIADLAEENLQRYFDKVDLIVLGGYAAGRAIEILQKRHPKQAFLEPKINYDLILRTRNYPEKIVVLAGKSVNDSLVRTEVRQKLPLSTLILPDCSGWEELVNDDLMTKEILQAELAWDFTLHKQRSKAKAEEAKSTATTREKIKPNAVLILNTHFWDLRKDLEDIFGWQVRVIDFRQKLLHDVCAALKLRGVDGRRAK